MSIWTARSARATPRPRSCPACEARDPARRIECPLCGEVLGMMSGEAVRGHADRRFHHDRDRPVETVQLRMGRSLRADDRADGQRVQRLGRHLLPRGRLACRRRRRRAERPRLLGVGERTVCLAQADDWLNTHETDESAFKTRGWLNQAATEKQLQYLPPECRARLWPDPLSRLGADDLHLQQARDPPVLVRAAAP